MDARKGRKMKSGEGRVTETRPRRDERKEGRRAKGVLVLSPFFDIDSLLTQVRYLPLLLLLFVLSP